MEYYTLVVEKKDKSGKNFNEDLVSSTDLKQVFLYADFAMKDKSTKSVKIVRKERGF